MQKWENIKARLDPLNLNKGIYNGEYDDIYNIPMMKKQEHEDIDLSPFHTKPKENAYSHFFLDDYQFERVWNQPKKYINKLKQFKGTCTPDFSLYTEYPIAVQIWNTYRNRWLGCYWQELGIKVIPTIVWSTYESYDFCFKGVPKGSTVAISTNGVLMNKDKYQLFLEGLEVMDLTLEPELIIIYGNKNLELQTESEIKFIINKNIQRMRSNGR